MAKDKVMHPTNMSKGGNAAKPVGTSGVFKGPTPSMDNMQPFNKNSGKKK